MHDDNTNQRFIELRVQGWPFSAPRRRRPARCVSSTPWTRFPGINMPNASRSGTRKATRRTWQAADDPHSRRGPRSCPRPNPFAECGHALESPIQFHQSHPDWSPPPAGSAVSPVPAPRSAFVPFHNPQSTIRKDYQLGPDKLFSKGAEAIARADSHCKLCSHIVKTLY
jgi:hypothetical protein